MASKAENHQLEDIISRVRSEIANDARISERGYQVADLQSGVKQFGPGDRMWEISYKTTSASFNPAESLGRVAWEISYKTSSVSSNPAEKLK